MKFFIFLSFISLSAFADLELIQVFQSQNNEDVHMRMEIADGTATAVYYNENCGDIEFELDPQIPVDSENHYQLLISENGCGLFADGQDENTAYLKSAIGGECLCGDKPLTDVLTIVEKEDLPLNPACGDDSKMNCKPL